MQTCKRKVALFFLEALLKMHLTLNGCVVTPIEILTDCRARCAFTSRDALPLIGNYNFKTASPQRKTVLGDQIFFPFFHTGGRFAL